MTRIIDIARKAKVSTAAVSDILRGKGSYSEETIKKVKEIAEKLNYKPNHSARSMRTGKFNRIALLSSTTVFHSILSSQTQNAILEALEERKLHLSLERIPEVEEEGERLRTPLSMAELCVDGILLNYHGSDKKFIEKVKRFNLPYIQINSLESYNCVRPDDYSGAYNLTEYLIKLGHREIHYANYWSNLAKDKSDEHYSFKARYEGYVSAMRNYGLQPVAMYGDIAIEHTKRMELSRQWLASEKRPTAVVTYSVEYTALPIMFAAISLGLRIPQDISICSFDNQHKNYFDLYLTTMLLPDREIGHTAVEMLLQRISEPKKDLLPRILPMTLFEGQTCAKLTTV